jgi:hypothetical protein
MMPDPLRVNDAPGRGKSAQAGGNMPASAPPELSVPPVSPPAERGIVRRLWPIIVLLILLSATAALWFHREWVMDWVRLRGYEPSAAVRALAVDTRMTSYGERLFFVNHPVIEDKDSFNEHCTEASTEVAVLGCYQGDRRGIYIYHVTEDRLDGIQQVTAAHEMLHQAYDRLRGAELDRINGLLQSYADQLTDQDIKDKLEAYHKLGTTDLLNEMHSIFGTEAADLPPALEAYYSQYFIDRKEVLALRAQYRSAFTQLTDQIESFDTQMDMLRGKIDAMRASLDDQEKTLKVERAALDSLLRQDKISEYNAAVPGFNMKVEAYRRDVAETNRFIDEHNAIMEKRNAIALERGELLEAQDSRADTAGAQ